MKKFRVYPVYYFFWIIFFIVIRALFFAFHWNQTSGLSMGEIGKSFLYGLRMDISFAAYICIFPFLLYLFKLVWPALRLSKVIKTYTVALIIILSFMAVADLELYTAWGFRMDTTPLKYFKTPREMLGTISSSPWIPLLAIWVLLCFCFIFLLRYFHIRMRNGRRKNLVYIFFGVFLIAFLFVPIRGGIQKIPLHISDVYFSDNLFADHAAINLPWNFMFSVFHLNGDINPYQYYNLPEAEKIVNNLYKQHPSGDSVSLLTTARPNIIFIIMESFTAKLVGSLGGPPGITPQLDSIAANGLSFTNIYAAGDRSEKGQVAILSGYPNQATRSIVLIPNKTVSLPSMAKSLASYGYHSSYTYGGELGWANIKSYLVNTGYTELLSKYSFSVSQRTTSWGVHDEFVFSRFYQDLKKEEQPFFATVFSLSSHEPYDVPLKHFRGDDELTQFENSVYYADSVLGDFILKIKKEPFWNNTLVVITADHGRPQPGNDPVDVRSKFHIPLVLTGGALKKKGIIDRIGSQTDIATTVLCQMGINTGEFRWGANLLAHSDYPFAFYNFNNGFGWVDSTGYASVDNLSHRIMHKSAGFDTTHLKFGRAYMQVSYQDYLER